MALRASHTSPSPPSGLSSHFALLFTTSMALWPPPRPSFPVLLLPLLLFLLAHALLLTCFAPMVVAKSSPRPITDVEIREKKNACYADIESGLWGWKCRSSVIEKENCALRCLSPVCYELIYESDPLEEGEKDFIRSQEYKYCMHKVSVGESLDGIKGTFDH